MHSKKERRKQSKVDAQEMNRFRVLVDMLEHDLEEFQLCDPQNYREHYNPLVPWAKLFAGIIAVILTALWLIQIIIFMLFNPPLHPFLNTYFTWFDGWFPLFGTLSVAVFGLYLLLAAAKGNFKFGTRFFLIKVHPMEYRKTLMNSFVFNIALILLCVLPVVQFCTDAFSQYARLTDADLIFGAQMKHLKGFRYFWQYNAFLFAILGFFLLALIYFAIFPSDRDHLNKVMREIKTKHRGKLANAEKQVKRSGGDLSGECRARARAGTNG
jgi:LMBR1 domain-containing protein 1